MAMPARNGRNVYREFARAYVRAERDYENAAQFGNVDKMDEAIARKQELEAGVQIRVIDPGVLKHD